MNRLPYNTFIHSGRYLPSPLRNRAFTQLNHFLSHRRRMTSIQMSQPRIFPSTGFDALDPSEIFEEEGLPDYFKERYYPVHIGEVFNSQYQVVSKLGFGSSSTAWLCRDLQ